jgi:hypothetical protein
VVFGPGDGLSLRFRADRLPPIRAGERRTFLARMVGYCKDMDLYTALSERVEPLPFAGMSGYPYGPGESPRDREGFEAYRKAWNTRRVTGSFLDPVDLPARTSTVNYPGR